MIGKYFYAVVEPTMEDIADGQYPEKTGQSVRFYEDYEQAIRAFVEPARTTEKISLYGSQVATEAPKIVGLYVCELSPEQIAQMKDITPSLGSRTMLEGKIDPDSIISVQWGIGADILHRTPELTQIEYGPHTHVEIQTLVYSRKNDFQVLQAAFAITPEKTLSEIDFRSPAVMAAITTAYSPDGFMNKFDENLSFEQYYGQTMMRQLVEYQGLQFSLQVDKFQAAYLSALDRVEGSNPELTEAQRAYTAMGQTIDKFRAEAVSRGDLQQQLMFNKMNAVHQAMGQLVHDGDARDWESVSRLMDQVVNSVDEHPNYNAMAAYVCDFMDWRDEQMHGDE